MTYIRKMYDGKSRAFQMLDLFEITPVLVCIAGKDGYFKNVNPAFVDKLGYSEAELFSQPVSSFIYYEDQQLTSEQRTVLLTGKALLNFKNRYLAKNGNIIWL